jgi:hypothetical protein
MSVKRNLTIKKNFKFTTSPLITKTGIGTVNWNIVSLNDQTGLTHPPVSD